MNTTFLKFSSASQMFLGDKIELGESQEQNMTIIAAMWESNQSILLASDSCITESPDELRFFDNQKLKFHTNAPLAWGYSGNSTIGEQFSDWLKSYKWPPGNLPDFQEEVSAYLSGLNGKQRKLVILSGCEPGDNDLTDVLVAGYFNQPFYFTVDDRGIITTYIPKDKICAIGSGKSHVLLIHSAYDYVKWNAPIHKRFEVIIGLSASKAKYCSTPISMLRVANNGIETINLEQTADEQVHEADGEMRDGQS